MYPIINSYSHTYRISNSKGNVSRRCKLFLSRISLMTSWTVQNLSKQVTQQEKTRSTQWACCGELRFMSFSSYLLAVLWKSKPQPLMMAPESTTRCSNISQNGQRTKKEEKLGIFLVVAKTSIISQKNKKKFLLSLMNSDNRREELWCVVLSFVLRAVVTENNHGNGRWFVCMSLFVGRVDWQTDSFCVSGLFLKITPYDIKIESENEDFLEMD